MFYNNYMFSIYIIKQNKQIVFCMIAAYFVVILYFSFGFIGSSPFVVKKCICNMSQDGGQLRVS